VRSSRSNERESVSQSVSQVYGVVQSASACRAHLGGVSVSVDQVLGAEVARSSPVEVELRRAVLVRERTAFQR